MATQNEDLSMALFCDFENIALGVRDAQYEKFDIKPILEKLLLKGSIVVKKAYCDWERYKAHKAAMHEANFELIEIPHVRQSGKNSADIRMVVDALDLCYTKAHLNTFVIISGDSDFSPLVSKLRENAKHVIGVGVKQSTSDLLIANCDEFIYYDDLVREREAKRAARPKENQRRSPEEELRRREELEKRRSQGIELAVATLEDLLRDRADDERVWASVLKEALKRRNPGFNESYYGFRAFGNLLEEAAARGLLEFGRDDKSGAYVRRRLPVVTENGEATDAPGTTIETVVAAEVDTACHESQPDQHGVSEATEASSFCEPVGSAPATAESSDPCAAPSETASMPLVALAPEAASSAADVVETVPEATVTAPDEAVAPIPETMNGTVATAEVAPPAAPSDKPRRRRSRPKPAAATASPAPAEAAATSLSATPMSEEVVPTASPKPRRRTRKAKSASPPAEQ